MATCQCHYKHTAVGLFVSNRWTWHLCKSDICSHQNKLKWWCIPIRCKKAAVCCALLSSLQALPFKSQIYIQRSSACLQTDTSTYHTAQKITTSLGKQLIITVTHLLYIRKQLFTTYSRMWICGLSTCQPDVPPDLFLWENHTQEAQGHTARI